MKLFDYAFCGDYNKKLNILALLSPEKWSFGANNDYSILRSYIEHTFNKAIDDLKVIETEKYALFNTGLFDQYFQNIYCYFVLNSQTGRQKWYLDGFYTEYQLGGAGITTFPKRVNYFNDISDLVFNTNLDICPQYDHIFGDTDNFNRLPESIKNSAIKIQIFDGSITKAKKMLDANYKTAVPQYYSGKIQLLIPLCLTDPSIPDLALVCSKTDDKSKYLGHTCLTLDMAYNNARLLAKPESNWLHP